MTVTVASLETRARRRADMINRNFVTSAEWLQYLNDGYKELYDILVARFEDWYTESLEFSVASGVESYDLPANFYKLRGLDRSAGAGEYITLRPFNFNDRNVKGGLIRRTRLSDVEYRIMRDTLIFEPRDRALGDYRMWYVPRANDLTVSSDTVDGVNGWEEYIVLVAAIKALQKEESDVSVLLAEKGSLYQRIELMSANRDGGMTERVTDVSMESHAYSRGF